MFILVRKLMFYISVDSEHHLKFHDIFLLVLE